MKRRPPASAARGSQGSYQPTAAPDQTAARGYRVAAPRGFPEAYSGSPNARPWPRRSLRGTRQDKSGAVQYTGSCLTSMSLTVAHRGPSWPRQHSL
eukprot:11954234-Alexandrium_andersonii.AAC.1